MSDENNVPAAGADAGAAALENVETTNAETAVAEQAATEQQDGDEGDSEGEPEQPRKKNGSTRLRERLDRQIAHTAALEERLRAFTEQRPPTQDRAVEQPPREEDFNGDYFAWQRALTRYETKMELLPQIEAAKAEVSKARQAEAMAQVASEFVTKEKAFRQAVPDYDDVISDAREDGLVLPPHMIDTIASSDNGPALVYHLAKNPNAAMKIASMPPLLAAREIGRIEAGIAPAKPRTESKAPPPVQAVKARSQIQKSPENMSMEEYMADFNRRNTK